MFFVLRFFIDFVEKVSLYYIYSPRLVVQLTV